MNDPLLEAAGPMRPPMTNGELVFAEPWEGRVFGMAHALAAAGVFTWDEFRVQLIASIQRWEGAADAAATYCYYECFAQALATLLAAKGVCDAVLLAARGAELAARAPGHDHSHDHSHEHD